MKKFLAAALSLIMAVPAGAVGHLGSSGTSRRLPPAATAGKTRGTRPAPRAALKTRDGALPAAAARLRSEEAPAPPDAAEDGAPALPAGVGDGISLPATETGNDLHDLAALQEYVAKGGIDFYLPGIYDNSQNISGVTATAPEMVRRDYRTFLKRIGFKDYSGMSRRSLKNPRLTKTQQTVLPYNGERDEIFNDARELAAEVMASLAARGFSRDSMEAASELTARLLSLQPLEPPSTLPPEIAKKGEEQITAWFYEVTLQLLGPQLGRIVSDVAFTIADEKTRSELPAAFLRRINRLKGMVERLLVRMYTDGEVGQTRYAGRALAASLVRFAKLQRRPEVWSGLKAKLEERDLHLENFVGDTLLVPDRKARGGVRRIELKTGDMLGERSAGREAAEITFAVRPPWKLWFKAWRQKLLGPTWSLWANPAQPPALVKGQKIRNALKLAYFRFRKWVGRRRPFARGYSHLGVVSVEEADGVAMAWAYDNYPNADEGGIRKIGIIEQFSLNGPFIRLGLARFDPDKLWEAFQKQAKVFGSHETVWRSGDGNWPRLVSKADHERRVRVPKSSAKALAAETHARAIRVLELMMSRFGVAFAKGFNNGELWRAYCSASVMLAYRMGALFEFQSEQDRWHTLVKLAKGLGLGKAKEQDTSGRIIWPGSLFIDPLIGSHVMVDFPRFTEVGRLPDPFTMPSYVELDKDLTKRLAAKLELSGGTIKPDEENLDRAMRTHFDARGDKGRAKGLAASSNPRTGYSAGLVELLGSEE